MATITDELSEEEYGMYINYADSQLSQDEAMRYYWGDNLGKLREIKGQVDPEEVFYYPLGIRPADVSSENELEGHKIRA